MAKTYIEIYQRRDGKFGWRERSGNHRIIAQGQGYSRRRDAVRGAKRAAPIATVKA